MTGAKLSDEILAGAFAGIIARSISAPFDVLKIRSQIETTAVGAKPISILNSFKNIIANEGFFALWKGNLSATYLWITYAMVQFTVYRYAFLSFIIQ